MIAPGERLTFVWLTTYAASTGTRSGECPAGCQKNLRSFLFRIMAQENIEEILALDHNLPKSTFLLTPRLHGGDQSRMRCSCHPE
jgi:hypothetical protein